MTPSLLALRIADLAEQMRGVARLMHACEGVDDRALTRHADELYAYSVTADTWAEHLQPKKYSTETTPWPRAR